MATPASIAVTMPVPPASGMSHMIARNRSVRKAERSQRGDLVPQSTAGIPAENEGDETNDAAGGVQRQDVLVRPAPAHPQQDLVFGRLPATAHEPVEDPVELGRDQARHFGHVAIAGDSRQQRGLLADSRHFRPRTGHFGQHVIWRPAAPGGTLY